VWLALRNHNLPSEWAGEDPADIATALYIIEKDREANER